MDDNDVYAAEEEEVEDGDGEGEEEGEEEEGEGEKEAVVIGDDREVDLLFVVRNWTSSIVLMTVLFSAVSCEGCEQLYTSSRPSGEKGNFKSPGYPNPYPNNLHCRYTFQGTRDERIKITFSDFDLETGTNAGCLFDYVDIFTIDMDEMKNLDDRLCGKDIPKAIIAVHQRVELVFKSDYAGAGHRGFLGEYEFIDETWQPFAESSNGCGDELITGAGGEIQSPGFPGPYPPDVQCTWMIRVDTDMKIILNFLHLDLGQSMNCMVTYVSMYNGFANPDMPAHDTVCGKLSDSRDQLKEFKSKTFRIVLRFHSGPVNEQLSTGFRIVWTAVRPPRDVEDQDGNTIEEPCTEFHCKGGEYCIDTSGLLCNRLPRYCIAKSLRCNRVPNCGAYDHSDEDGCLTKSILILICVTCPIAILLVAICIYVLCKQYQKSKELKPDFGLCGSQSIDLVRLQRLEGSPSCKRYSIVSLSQGSLCHHPQHPAVRRSNSYSGARTSFRQNTRYVAPVSIENRAAAALSVMPLEAAQQGPGARGTNISIGSADLYVCPLRTSPSYHMALDTLNFYEKLTSEPQYSLS